MKHKRRNTIPDFGAKRPSDPQRAALAPRKPARALPERNIKPQATSVKSGRRGQ